MDMTMRARTGMALAAAAALLAALCAFAAPQAALAEELAASPQQALGAQASVTRNVYLMPTADGRLQLYTRIEETGRIKHVRFFTEGELESWRCSLVSGDWAYLTRSRQLKWRSDVYACNLNTGKLTKVLGKAAILDSKGNRALVTRTFRTDVGTERFAIYKASGGKLTKVKELAAYGFNATLIGNWVYYGKATSDDFHKMSAWRCKITGKGAEKLGGPWTGAKTSYSNGQVILSFPNSKYCYVSKSTPSGSFELLKYTYKTKKLTRA